MIIRSEQDVTSAVLGEMHRTPNERTKQILASLVNHLHAFVREVKLTEREFQEAIGYVNAIGQKTTPSHNEAMLLAGALGVSNLVCLLNNRQPTQANNLGPFYRAGSPRCANGDSLLRSPTDGTPLAFEGWVKDRNGRPIAGAEVDVWQSAPSGLYENQDPSQAEMNLRGTFTTDAEGAFSFRSVKPGFKTIASQVYDPDDPHLETDSQFGVTQALIGNYRRREDGYSLEFTFVLESGESVRPQPPISAKRR
jgi:hypothetical protein